MGLFLRISAALENKPLSDFWRGEWEYYALGTQMARSGELRHFPGFPATAFRMPLYPAYLGMVFEFSTGLKSARLAQAAADAGGILLTYGLGAAFLGPACALLAAWLYALDPVQISSSVDLTVESFQGLLISVAFLSMISWSRRRESLARAAVAGLAVGFCLFCRSPLIFWPLTVLVLMACKTKGVPWRRAGLVYLFFCCAPLTPWVARNFVIFGEFIPFESGPSAIAAWASSLGHSSAYRELDTTVKVPRLEEDFYARTHALPEAQRRRELWRSAWAKTQSHPLEYAGAALSRLPQLWSEMVPWLLLSAGVLSLRVMPFPIAAAWVLVFYFNIHIFLTVLPRYARPLSGILYALSAAGIIALWCRVRGVPTPDGGESPSLIPRLSSWLWTIGFVYVYASFLLWGETRKGVEKFPPGYQRLKALNDEAVNLALTGDDLRATTLFDRVLAEKPDHGESLLSRAILLERRGETEAAGRDWESALSLLETGHLPPSAAGLR